MYGYSTIYGGPELGAWYDTFLSPFATAKQAASDSALNVLAPSALAEIERLRKEKTDAESRNTMLIAGGVALLVVGGLAAYGVGHRRRR